MKHTHTQTAPADLQTYQAAALAVGRPYSTVKGWANKRRIRKFYAWHEGTMRVHVSAAEVRAAAGLKDRTQQWPCSLKLQQLEEQEQLQQELKLVPDESLQELRREVRSILAQELRTLLAALEE